MLTLKKVKELVEAPSHAKRTPSPKMLFEEGIVLLRREFDQGSHLTVYNSGYVLFSAGKRNTVFHIHDCCGDYAYDAAEGKGDVIKEEYFENCEWHIRALFEGERKMEDNQAKCEGAGRSNVCVSYHALSEDWSEIADRTINMLEKIIENGRKEKRSPSRGYSKGRVHSCQQYAEVRAENRTTERSLIMELNFIKCGDYYIPDIKVKNPNIRLGKWGRMRKEYLRLANPVLFSDMVLNETLYEHCAEIEETAKKRMEIIVPQLAKAYGVTEQLKAENQIEWVRQMNACVAQAEEAIKGELIYC